MKTATLAAVLFAAASYGAAVPAPVPVPVPEPVDGAFEAEPKTLVARWGWWRKKPQRSPFEFTSTYFVTALPNQVIATNQTAVPGQDGACGYYNFGINRYTNTICYNITLVNIQGTYQSPARTATHVHEAVRGRAGPPRLAFDNPVADPNYENVRRSAGCLTGPFTTGVITNGTDTGTGFRVAQIEANPSGFFADVHTNLFTQGAIRGQLS